MTGEKKKAIKASRPSLAQESNGLQPSNSVTPNGSPRARRHPQIDEKRQRTSEGMVLIGVVVALATASGALVWFGIQWMTLW